MGPPLSSSSTSSRAACNASPDRLKVCAADVDRSRRGSVSDLRANKKAAFRRLVRAAGDGGQGSFLRHRYAGQRACTFNGSGVSLWFGHGKVKAARAVQQAALPTAGGANGGIVSAQPNLPIPDVGRERYRLNERAGSLARVRVGRE